MPHANPAANLTRRTAGTTPRAAGARRARAAALPLEPARRRQARSPITAAATPRPRSTETRSAHRRGVEVLWVKGSGGDLGSMKLDGFATLYHGQARGAEGPLPRRRARGRDGRLSAALHLQPQSARGLDRHAAARLSALSRMSTTCIRTPSSRSPRRRTRRELTQRDLRRRDRLAALAAARLRARPAAARHSRARTRKRTAWCSRATASSPGATTAEGLLRDDAPRSSTARSPGSTQETGRQAGLRRAVGCSRCRAERGARSPRG